MTYISQDLDRICRNWCPIVNMCSNEHECGARITIRNAIWQITGKEDDDEE